MCRRITKERFDERPFFPALAWWLASMSLAKVHARAPQGVYRAVMDGLCHTATLKQTSPHCKCVYSTRRERNPQQKYGTEVETGSKHLRIVFGEWLGTS